MKLAGIPAVFAAAFAFSAAFAAPSSEQAEMCAVALDEEGIASLDAYRADFVKAKGGATTTVTVKLIPITDEGEAMVAECRIKNGEVLEASIV